MGSCFRGEQRHIWSRETPLTWPDDPGRHDRFHRAKMRCGAAAHALERRGAHARSDMKAKPMTRFLCLICFVLISSGALAQTAREHDACARDAARFCRPV